ncbi:unnamed protein product [Ceratitis capitata]|uniref:(Mediterranean fruit fly) hypothetical protein n=1 Tax=Ceratitis capitata TaxID=7213 RepID=A0A811V464_CERCA|nr:unnamed protein product [Ceratitis capitata]
MHVCIYVCCEHTSLPKHTFRHLCIHKLALIASILTQHNTHTLSHAGGIQKPWQSKQILIYVCLCILENHQQAFITHTYSYIYLGTHASKVLYRRCIVLGVVTAFCMLPSSIDWFYNYIWYVCMHVHCLCVYYYHFDSLLLNFSPMNIANTTTYVQITYITMCNKLINIVICEGIRIRMYVCNALQCKSMQRILHFASLRIN